MKKKYPYQLLISSLILTSCLSGQIQAQESRPTLPSSASTALLAESSELESDKSSPSIASSSVSVPSSTSTELAPLLEHSASSSLEQTTSALSSWSSDAAVDVSSHPETVRPSEARPASTVETSDSGAGLTRLQPSAETDAPAASVNRSQTSTSGSARPTSPRGQVTFANQNAQTGTVDVVISDVYSPKGVKRVLVPIWSEKGGQDDVHWYVANRQTDGTYKVTLKASEHKGDSGRYHVHVYYEQNDSSTIGVAATHLDLQYQVPKPRGQVTFVNQNAQAGTVDILISDVYSPKGVKRVLVPIWSEKGGQDDVNWYVANRQTDGTYKVTLKASEHKGDSGRYHVHVYYDQHEGGLAMVSASSLDLQYQAPKPRAKVTFANQNAQTGTVDVLISDVYSPKGVKRVLVPIWSEKGGQDDIKWYSASRQANGTYKVTLKASEHKGDSGPYHVHVYYDQNDSSTVGVAATQLDLQYQVPKPRGQVTFANQNVQTGTVDVLISDVYSPKGVKRVLVPIWSEKGGQDDVNWYVANRQANGTYKVTLKASNHKGDSGRYHVHVYYDQNEGGSAMVAASAFNMTLTGRSSGQVHVTQVNQAQGTFEIVVDNILAPHGIKEISVPTWAEVNGQNDLVWYKAQRQGDGTYRAQVNLANHRFETGTYHIHAYMTQANGQQLILSATQVAMQAPKAQMSSRYLGTGHYEVTVSNVYGDSPVQIAVWAGQQGQDDLRWYPADKIAANTYRIRFNAQQHRQTGTYHAHAYRNVSGKMMGLGTTQFQVNRANFQAPYYTQRNYGHYFGLTNLAQSGCVPTVLAMAFSGIKGYQISPVDVASYLYHYTPYFNKAEQGTMSTGIILASRNWGLTATPQASKAAVIQALKEGYYVTEAVRASRFINAPYTHEILLKGYDNQGRTYVMDPLNANNNGWYSLDYLFSIQSNDPQDYLEGSRFFKITD